VFVDLDRFKALNDTYGHAAGDAVLVAVAARLVGYAGLSRSVCRLGGDEFAVLLSHRGDDVASELAGLHRSLCAPVPWRGQLVAVGASVGGGVAARRTSIAAALERADSAMYAAKRAGGGIRVAGPRVPEVAAGAASRVRRWEAVA
jgi:diguanylate cyclase (GGDEF)-like protein